MYSWPARCVMATSALSGIMMEEAEAVSMAGTNGRVEEARSLTLPLKEASRLKDPKFESDGSLGAAVGELGMAPLRRTPSSAGLLGLCFLIDFNANVLLLFLSCTNLTTPNVPTPRIWPCDKLPKAMERA